MHWYGSSSLTVEQNGALLNEQAGGMIQLAEDHGIPEVWITEMGSGYDASAATEEVGPMQQIPGKNVTLTPVTSSANSFNGSKAPL